MNRTGLPRTFQAAGRGSLLVPLSPQERFTDAAYQKGKVLTLAAFAVALLVLVLGIVLDRRSITSKSATA